MLNGEFRLLTDQELVRVYHEHMRRDFPADELKPLSYLQKMRADGHYDPYALFREGEVVGYAFYWKAGESYMLLDYFAVTPEERNKGTGGALLRDMLEHFCVDGRGVFCEAEIPNSGDPEVDALRTRRVNFYKRNGMKQMGFTTKIFNVPYVVLAHGPEISDEELMEIDRHIYRSGLPTAVYEKNVVIPWKPEARA